MAIMPFKVTDFGTNRKPICDFLLVINSNLPPIFSLKNKDLAQATSVLHCPFYHNQKLS